MLDIPLDFWSIYTGKALRQLSRAPYEGCAFPLVRTLLIDIAVNSQDNNDYPAESDEDSQTGTEDCSAKKRRVYPPETRASIMAFVLRLKEMAPMVHELRVKPTVATERLLNLRNPHVVYLVQQLFSTFEPTTWTMGDTDLPDHCIDFESVSNLVHAHITVFRESASVIPLVFRSAHTLQTLHIRSNIALEIPGLIRDQDSGKYMDYPRLRKLTMDLPYVSSASQNLAFGDAAPFPSLQKLSICNYYPFNDDVVFRGNSSTLEFLEVALYPATVAMLKKHIFTSTSHPKLQCVKAEPLDGHTSSTFATAAAYMAFVLSIAPNASVRVFSGLLDYDELLLPVLTLLGNHPSIQVLSMPDMQLSFWDVISLIKLLPLLSDLQSFAPIIGELPQGVDVADLPKYVFLNFAPMGERFRCWHFEHYNNDYDESAMCVLLLALVCPSYVFADVNYWHRKPFTRALKKIMEPGFCQYAPWLQLLLSE
ncbi:hypothetical protein GGI20_000581 [Coemansia sp. BCRC 34301]|nr:hypothetical protein GGI20_000581 [Coemansia sp. BCRC 34301]